MNVCMHLCRYTIICIHTYMLIRLCVLFSLLSFIIIYVLSDAPRHFKVKGNGAGFL